MATALLSIFVASLLGSLHCAGMCGPLVGFCAGTSKLSVWALGAYHLSRLSCYALLGAIAGSLGAAVDLGGEAAGWGRAAAVAAGVLMIGFGLGSLFSFRLGDWLRRVGVLGGNTGRGPGRASLFVQSAMGRARAMAPAYRSAAVGGLSAFLPCGWLYAFVAAAAGTADPFSGALVMASFWAGTVPILLALGIGVSTALGPLRRRAPALVAVLLIGMGLASVFGRLKVPSFEEAMGPDVGARALAGELNSEGLPCCDGESAADAEGLGRKQEACGCTHTGPCVVGQTCGCPGCGKDQPGDQ